MKTYNKRYLQTQIRSISVKSIETKDGIIWSIDTTARKCGVQFLGSSHTLTVRFPPAWATLPGWIQLGNPVQIRFLQGKRNSLEILGPGQSIPTPSTGNYIPDNITTALPNGILSGCNIIEIPLEPQMGVLIETGSIRIAGSTIDIDSVKMNSTFFKMDMGGNMNSVAAAIEISPAPTEAGNYRYDLFAAGTDGIIDYHIGTTFLYTAASAVIPSISTDHIEIGRILIPYGKSIIRNSDINVEWSSAIPSNIIITADSTNLTSTQNTASILVTVRDGYGNNLAKDSGNGWRLELEIVNGTGKIRSTEGTSTSIIGAYAGSSAGYTFSYEREGTAVDISPLLTARLISPSISNNFSLTLRDSSGDIMTS